MQTINVVDVLPTPGGPNIKMIMPRPLSAIKSSKVLLARRLFSTNCQARSFSLPGRTRRSKASSFHSISESSDMLNRALWGTKGQWVILVINLSLCVCVFGRYESTYPSLWWT